jgi:hypothetical protein
LSYGFTEFLKDLCEKNVDPDGSIYEFLSTTDTSRLKTLLARLDKVRKSDASALGTTRAASHKYSTRKAIQAEQSRLLGKLLEQVMLSLLRGCKGIKVLGNIRTTTSEIDFLVQVGPTALAIPIFAAAATHIIGEAKCYSSGFKSEWVNELVGLMQLHGTSHSILFTACPSKKLRTDHRHIIQLHGMTGRRVVPFGLAQVHQIASGKNFLSTLSDQYVKVLNATSDLPI